jgi:hypothetical protein
MAKKPHKGSITKALKAEGAKQSVFMKARVAGRMSNGFQLEDLPNGEIHVTDNIHITNPKISPHYEANEQNKAERISRNLHFYTGILNNAGYQTESYQVGHAKGIAVVNPDRVYGPPKPPELEQ